MNKREKDRAQKELGNLIRTVQADMAAPMLQLILAANAGMPYNARMSPEDETVINRAKEILERLAKGA